MYFKLAATFLCSLPYAHGESQLDEFKASEFECAVHPISQNAICFDVRSSESVAGYVDYQEVHVLSGRPTLMQSQQMEIVTPSHVLFSDEGKYMAVVYTEEGHPFFLFYESDQYIGIKDAKPIRVLEDYYLQEVLGFNDKGEFSWGSECNDVPCRRAVYLGRK